MSNTQTTTISFNIKMELPKSYIASNVTLSDGTIFLDEMVLPKSIATDFKDLTKDKSFATVPFWLLRREKQKASQSDSIEGLKSFAESLTDDLPF